MKPIKGVKIKERYYRNPLPTNVRHSPIKYQAWGHGSTDKIDEVLIFKDPRLKKHHKLERAMMHHEETEIRLRSKGMSEPKAHKIAMSKEPKLIKGKSLKQMWEMIRE